MRQKYIVFKTGNLEDIVTFSELMGHNDFARALGNQKVLSAGFIEVYVDHNGQLACTCFGRSVTLELDSRGDLDTQVAMRRLYGDPY